MRPRGQNKSYSCFVRNESNETVCRMITCTNATYICTLFIQIIYLLTDFIKLTSRFYFNTYWKASLLLDQQY
jgi:hypothetical protein